MYVCVGHVHAHQCAYELTSPPHNCTSFCPWGQDESKNMTDVSHIAWCMTLKCSDSSAMSVMAKYLWNKEAVIAGSRLCWASQSPFSAAPIQSGTLCLAVTSFCVAFVDNPCDKASFKKMEGFHF